jgi:chromosomal replication initiator protein
MFDVWKSVLAEVEQSIPREQYSTWFTGTELVNIDNGVVTIGVPNVFKIKQLEKKYFGILRDAFLHNKVDVTEIRYIVQSNIKPRVRAREVPIIPSSPSAPIQVARTVDTERVANMGRSFQTGLNPRYTLANFVIGSNNDLAVSVARNIIDQPGGSYNPFFLYGGPGLGKTHLVQAIGNELLARNPKLKVLYTPVSSFYSDFIKSLQAKKSDEFRQKFRKLDVLIIDDFQMIMNKDASQVEFFDIFNELYNLSKQVIVTSDRLPNQIKSVDERLASRLTWAGAYDLQLPQFEDKCAILRAKAEFNGIEVEDEAIEYLAENVKTNIRDLEGEFNHLLAVAELKNMSPLEVINEGYVNTARSPQAKTLSPKQVIEKVAKYYNMTPKEMCSKSRVAHIKNARQVAMYMLSKELNMSTPKIAMEVGVKDHTTVMHGIKKIEADLRLNFSLRDQIAALREKVYG